MDPRNKEVNLDSLMYGTIGGLTEQELKKQEAEYIYRYRYNGGGATQVWLSSGRWYLFYSATVLLQVSEAHVLLSHILLLHH